MTLVFTDIEGSTRLLERYPSSYANMLEQHNGILSAAFERASAAMTAAVDAQLALKGALWPDGAEILVRMGLHTGEADVVGRTYVGMTVHIAARVSAAGHGGQVLVTDVTHHLGAGVEAINLGRHQLKDVGEFGIRQLTHPGLPVEFPALRTLSAMPNNLPASVDGFIGRHVELAEVMAALGDSRLVTLTGAGGSGKTRIALEAGATALGSYRDGVWFVSLSVAASGDRVVPLVAAALRLAERTDEPLEATLESWLRDRETLLILDNCEHIVPAVAAFANHYLQQCARLRLLTTSREFLGSRGERAIAVPPLNVSDDPLSRGVSDAVELFLVRAAAAAPSFDSAAVDRAAVAQICRRLDGLPLAIELAAARLRALSLAQLAARLDDRFRLLSGSGRSDLPRQRTLEAVVAWSYDLLTDSEREVFSRLAVFPAHFSLETAETVVGGDSIDEADVMDLLTRLVEKSLVTTVVDRGTVRYQLLETLRHYALDRLTERHEISLWRNRLLVWAMTRVQYVEESMRRPAQDAAIASATEDAETLRSAMDWALECDDVVAALRIAAAVPVGLHGERRRIITSLLDRLGSGVEPLVAGHAYAALGNMAFDQGDWEASSESSAAATGQFVLAGSKLHAAWGAYNGAHAAWGAGDLVSMDALVRQAIEGFRSHGDAMGLGWALWSASLRTSDLDEAERLAAEADELLRTTGAPMGIAHNVEGRGIVAFDRGELSKAAEFVAEAVELFASYGNLGCCAHALEAAAVVVGHGGQPEAATELLEAAEELRRRSGQGHRPWEIRARHGDIEARIAPLSAAVHEAALAAGRSHTLTSAALSARNSLAAVARPAMGVDHT